MCVYMYVWLGVSWNVSPLRYRKLATVLHHNNISASCMCVYACVCEGQILTQSICTITFVTFLSFESDLMLVANFQRESRQLTHKHLVARSDKDNKEKQVTGTVCVGVSERASALTQCVSVFVIQPSQRKQSLSSIPLLSPSSPSLSLGYRLLATRHFRPKNKPLEMKRTRNKT